ncbi:MAG: GNAT family N-acetyltransferase [Clostridia bacterium]|nr:GNAT family N-acetyltransferase [Clostridia bacterium]
MITRAEGLSASQLQSISRIIGEAFVTNELFRNWGSIPERHDDVLKYMEIYVDYAYRTGELYVNKDLTGFIGLEDSGSAPVFPRLKMIFRLFTSFSWKRIRSLLSFVKQIDRSNAQYASRRHLDVLMVCVEPGHQGKGIATELVQFAKNQAKEKGIPLLFDTDMKQYAEMYQHLGCTLYNTVTADNGVTRYSLVWQPQ